MGSSLARSLIEAHRATREAGAPRTPGELALRVDQVAVDDTAGVLIFLAFETLEPGRVALELVLACAGRSALRLGHEVAEAQLYLQRAAARYGGVFSRFGNGPAHQVHVARFGAPGRVVLGCDPRITAGGALGMLALPAGEIEIGAALAGVPLDLALPGVSEVLLVGRAASWVSGQDLVLELTRRLPAATRGEILELTGPGLVSLPLAERITVARQAAELGALTVVFPSDEITRRFLRAQGREADWKLLAPDPDAEYARAIEVDLGLLEPLVALPAGAGVVPLSQPAGHRVAAVVIGPEAGVSDLARVARVLGGRTIAPGLDFVVAFGSRQVLESANQRGLTEALVAAGARVSEIGEDEGVRPVVDGATIGFGLRERDQRLAGGSRESPLFLAGPDACAAAALAGAVADPRALFLGSGITLSTDRPVEVRSSEEVEAFVVNESHLERPPADGSAVEVPRGENLPLLPLGMAIDGPVRGVVLARLGDRVTIDQMMPSGARVAALHTRMAALAAFAFAPVAPELAARAAAQGGGMVVAGREYGSGPPRPQAALVAVELGLRAVLAISIARGHRDALVLQGVLPLLFARAADLGTVEEGDELEIPDLPEGLEPRKPVVVRNLTRGTQVALRHDLSARDVERVLAGGLLRQIRAGLRRGMTVTAELRA